MVCKLHLNEAVNEKENKNRAHIGLNLKKWNEVYDFYYNVI